LQKIELLLKNLILNCEGSLIKIIRGTAYTRVYTVAISIFMPQQPAGPLKQWFSMWEAWQPKKTNVNIFEALH